MSPIQQVAVIGLGTMGHGIAQTFAMAGCEVTGFDNVQAANESLHDRVRQNLRDFVGAELLPADQVYDVLKRITVSRSEADAVRDAQFVTEAIREDLVAKQELFERLETLVADDTILASNSST